MITARAATLLTVFFAVLCVLQVSRIAQTLDKTRSQLSNQSTGAINSLTQIDRNLDQFIGTLVAHRFLTSTATDKPIDEKTIPAYREKFEIFWASVTVLNLRTPGTDERMPAGSKVLEETYDYLEAYDPLINGDALLTHEQSTRLYRDTLTLSDRYHELAHDYFLALSIFSDELKDRTRMLYLTFLGFAVMVLTCGGISLYSLFRANRKSEQLIERSNLTQARLTQVVDELRSGKLENKAKDSFLAAASHDLRQPLHALGLFLGALEKHIQPAGQHIMKKAQQSSSALTKLLSSLLDLSRLDAGAVRVQQRNFNLGHLITTLENEFQPTALLRGMTLDFQTTDHTVFSDRILIDRVLRNLIENALTHSHGHTLELCTRKCGSQLLVTLSDDGVGIPGNKQDDIFSEYYQIGNPERDRSKGLGIGLAIVKRLCKLLEVDLQLRSEHQAGCTFTLTMPLSVTDSIADEDTSGIKARPEPARTIIVGVIEDEQGIRDGMELMLHSEGYTTLIADSADGLLRLLDKSAQKPDVLVSDFRLRYGATGETAIRKVVSRLGENIPSVIITGDTSPQRVQALTRGGYRLMHKPVEPQDLLKMIDLLAAQSEENAPMV